MDADDTLFDFHKASAFALESVFTALSLPYSGEARELYEQINAGVWLEFEQGMISKEKLRTERFRRFFTASGFQADCAKAAELYIEALAQTAFFIPGSLQLLKDISVLPVVIVTNGIAFVQESRFARAGILEYCAGYVISEKAGCAKPDPGIFEAAMQYVNGCGKADIIMVGDSLTSDIRGALNAGIASCWYNPAGILNTSPFTPDYEISNLMELKGIIGL
ncbi:MAG: YjjG family noncanonical pyrimidine nucleotidase [Spirochaetales bacterium]|nr:YjjG family noncanonical pyrimidine nucleotidase [Spirochaetales bacterium]